MQHGSGVVLVLLAAWLALGGVDLAVRLVRPSRKWMMSAARRTLFEHIFERGRIVSGRMIQIEADTWVVMREYPQYPKAVIQGFKNTAGEARFMVLTWDPIRSKRRLVDVYTTLGEAEKSVPWPGPPANPGPPYQSPEAGRAERERRGGDGNGYAGATFDRAEQARKIAERAAARRTRQE